MTAFLAVGTWQPKVPARALTFAQVGLSWVSIKPILTLLLWSFFLCFPEFLSFFSAIHATDSSFFLSLSLSLSFFFFFSFLLQSSTNLFFFFVSLLLLLLFFLSFFLHLKHTDLKPCHRPSQTDPPMPPSTPGSPLFLPLSLFLLFCFLFFFFFLSIDLVFCCCYLMFS